MNLSNLLKRNNQRNCPLPLEGTSCGAHLNAPRRWKHLDALLDAPGVYVKAKSFPWRESMPLHFLLYPWQTGQ